MASKPPGRQPIDSLSGTVPRRQPQRSPVAPTTRAVASSPITPGKTPKTEPKPNAKTPKVISFELTLPKLPKVLKSKRPNIPKLSSRRLALLLAAIVLGALLIFGAIKGITRFTGDRGVSGTSTEVQNIPPASPNFEVVQPQTEKPNQPTGYDPEKRVASFADTIGGVAVTVSQQPLPDNFKQNPGEKVLELAKNFKANKNIDAQGTMAYFGTSSEDGTQTVLFTKNNLLIFIRAEKDLNKDALVQYIVALK